MLKVMIVDDEPYILQGLQLLIDWNHEGFEIDALMSNGKEALDYLADHKIDLIISDIKMPVMNGLDLLDEVERQHLSEAKFVFLTGYDDFSYVQRAIRNNCLDYILKPVSKEDLLALLHKVSNLNEEKEKVRESQKNMEDAFLASNLMSIIKGKFDENNIDFVNNHLQLAGGIRFVDIEMMTEDSSDEEDDYDEEERENSMDRIARILAVLAVVIIVAIIALIVGGRNGLLPIGGGSQNAQVAATDEMVVMPNVIGIDVSAARSALVKQGLIPELTYEESDKYTVGVVMDSSVEEGTEIPVGTTVVLTVCGNSGSIVPDVVGLLREEAVDLLTETGFNVNIMEVSSEDVEAGIVVGQDPEGETQAEEGTYVTIQVSGGPDLSGKTEMPSLYGMTEQEARNTLNAFGLKAGNVRTIIDADSENRGLVIAQDVEPGELIDEGTAVNFDIAGQQTYSYSADISAPTHSEDPDYKSGTSVHITIVTEDDQKLLDTTTSAFPYRMGCTGITSEYGTLTMTYEVTITETVEEEVEEGTGAEEGADTGADTGATDESAETGEGGRKTVIRTIERTEERTITRELTFTPEN